MKQPNFLIFMTDQQRACSVFPGHPYQAVTPCLDAFRNDATTFRQTYTVSPHCCPSRASFLTGLMPAEHGVWNNVSVTNALSRGMKENIRPWSVDLKESGYRMLFSGKWHASNYQQPGDYGWEHVFPQNMCSGTGKSPDEQEREARAWEMDVLRKGAIADPPRGRGPGEILRPGQTPYVHYGTSANPLLNKYFWEGEDDNPFGDRTVVDSAIESLNRHADEEPWCLFVGTLGPHDPYIAPQRFLDLYRDREFPLPRSFDDPMDDKPALYRRTRDAFRQLTRQENCDAIRHYLAFCSYEDWLFGRLIAHLRASGAYDNTMILYLSDHGDYMGDHGLWCKGLPCFLGAYHVPALLKMPGGGGQGNVRDEFVSLMDFGPTFLDVAGVKSPVAFTGQSLLPLLGAGPAAEWRDALFFQTNGNETYGIQRSILTRRWHFVYNGFDYDELYDIGRDPDEMHNLARDPELRPVIREMYRRIWEFGLSHEEPLLNDYIMTALADFGPGVALTTPDAAR